MIFRDGWYYLLVTHGSCCAGANSSYNIRMGRARKVTGPFVDNMGIDMLQGGGKLFLGIERPLDRPRAFRAAGPRRRRAEVLLALRGRPRSRRHQRARPPPAALARRLAECGRQPHRGHLSDRIRADRHRARAGGAGRAGGRSARPRRPRGAGRGTRPRRCRRPRGRRWRRTDSVAGRGAGLGELASWPRRRADVAVHAAGAAEVDRGAGRRTPADIPARRTSRSPSRARIARWRRRATANWSRVPAFTGAAEQLWRVDQLTDGSYRVMPKAVPESRSRWCCRPSAAACRRSRDSGRQRSAALAVQDAVTACATANDPWDVRWRRRWHGPGRVAGAVRTPARPVAKPPDADGFLQRWIDPRADPRSRPARPTVRSRRPSRRRISRSTHRRAARRRCGEGRRRARSTWHTVDTARYNVNLYHFAYGLKKPTSNVLFWVVTVVEAPREMTGVRLAIGSNAASVWWVNGAEVIGIYNERQTVIDDGVSKRLTLQKGANVDPRRHRQRRGRHRLLRAVPRRRGPADPGHHGRACRVDDQSAASEGARMSFNPSASEFWRPLSS